MKTPGLGHPVVFVGRRNGAVRAARQLRVPYQVVAPGDCATFSASPDATPVAVIAVTEAAVIPAAQLRERLMISGLSLTAARLCTDKLEMKRAISAAGLRCARYLPVDGSADSKTLAETTGFPLVLKTRTGSGGRGARVVHTANELPENVSTAHVAESFVDGIEMSVESFVIDAEPVFVNLTEYVEPRWVNLLPASLDAQTTQAVEALNHDAIRALGIRDGITHMEVFLTRDGVVFGELAARPPGGHLMRLLELAYGFDPWVALVEIALGRRPTLAAAAARSAGVRFIHPGQGVVQSVSGTEAITSLPGLDEFVCKLAPGDSVSPRESVGQHHGFAIFSGPADTVRADLNAVRDLLHIDTRRTDS